MEAIKNLGGPGKLFLGLIPDSRCSIAEHSRARGLQEAAALGLTPHALSKDRRLFGGVRRGGTLDGRRIGDRSLIANGDALGVERLRTPDRTELDFPRFRSPSRLLAGHVRQFLGLQGDTRSIHAQVESLG